MSLPRPVPDIAEPGPSVVRGRHVIYALHAFSLYGCPGLARAEGAPADVHVALRVKGSAGITDEQTGGGGDGRWRGPENSERI